MEQWNFLTNHAQVLLCVSDDPEMRLRDIALAIGITERATQRIIADLVGAGYLSRERVGRRNRYQLHPELALRHPQEHNADIGSLLELLTDGQHPRTAATGRAGRKPVSMR